MKEREKERKEAHFVLVSHPSTLAKLSLETQGPMAPVSLALCSTLEQLGAAVAVEQVGRPEGA